jgi:hypothetical protein
LLALGFLSLLLAAPARVAAEDIRFEGVYTAAPNGDVTVVYKFTPPMAIYQQLRNSISNLYLLLRGLASGRAEIEVVDKKADWDDSSRTLTISFKTLGLARNLGNRWEIDVLPGLDFSNLNEATKTVYFNEDNSGPLGRVRGLSRLQLPAQARDFRWDEGRRVVSYVMPAPEGASGGAAASSIFGVVLLVVGALLTGASFLRQAAPAPAGPLQVEVEVEAEPKLIKQDDKHDAQ